MTRKRKKPETAIREVFAEEASPGSSVRLIAAGDITEWALDGLQDFILRHRARLEHLRDLLPPA